MKAPTLSIVIPTRETRELTLRCLDSLPAGGVEPVEVVVVDDGSSDGTADAVRSAHPGALVAVTGRRCGFGGAANLGAERTSAEVILFLNSDTEVLEGALAALVAAFADDAALGVGGGELLDPDGEPQWRAGRRPTTAWLFLQASGLGAALARAPGRRLAGTPGRARLGDVDWVSGAAMAVRRGVWSECGPFDTDFAFYCQDLDLCTAVRGTGRRVAVVPGFRVLHHHGASITAVPGAVPGFHPAKMWADLVRFVGKHDGAPAAARAARVVRLGARVRLLGRAFIGPFAGDRAAWRRDTDAYRSGLDALR
jgi:GT2 family glycosyltransferase